MEMNNINQDAQALITRAEEIEKFAQYADGQAHYDGLRAARALRARASAMLKQQAEQEEHTVEIPFEILLKRNREAAEVARNERVMAAIDKMTEFFNKKA